MEVDSASSQRALVRKTTGKMRTGHKSGGERVKPHVREERGRDGWLCTSLGPRKECSPGEGDLMAPCSMQTVAGSPRGLSNLWGCPQAPPFCSAFLSKLGFISS